VAPRHFFCRPLTTDPRPPILSVLPPLTGPSTYDSTHNRLDSLLAHPDRRLWSPLEVYSLVLDAAGDLDLASLSEAQARGILNRVGMLWSDTPRKTRGKSFHDALVQYHTGDDAADAEAADRSSTAAARAQPPLSPPAAHMAHAGAPAPAPPPAHPFVIAAAAGAAPPPSAHPAPPLLPSRLAPDPRSAPASAGPSDPPDFVADANATLAALDLPFGALFPPADSQDLPAGVAALSLTPIPNVQAVERYYTYDSRRYHGADTESLYRHVAAFRSLCTRMGVHPSDHATCVPSSLGPSRHNLPSLCHDNPAASETALWTLIQQRVYTPARMSRLRTIWQSTTMASFPRQPDETSVRHFGGLKEFLKHLQEQLGPLYQHRLSLRDRVLDTISTEPYWADLVARNVPDADALIDVVELLLEARHARAVVDPALKANGV